MYGRPMSPPQPRPSGPGARAMAARLFFAAFPLLSLGFLGWVPALRLAIQRRRPLDWALFGLSVVLCVVLVVLASRMSTDPDVQTPEDDQAVVFLLLYVLGATVHALLGDRFVRPSPYRRPVAPAYGYPGPQRGGYAQPHPPRPQQPLQPRFPHQQQPAPQPFPHPSPPAQSSRPASPEPVPSGSAPPEPQPGSPRMRQVASELDELDELLRRREGR